jgi:hypothetical protein
LLKTCFVIQKFDGDVFDKRYRETFAPAIERAGAKPIRADEVLGTRPIVSKIEEGLRNADVAFAEVSEDNPNVFLELGFALALKVPTVILCDKSKRLNLPFDIAHRPITFYKTQAMSDYAKVSSDIESAISAALIESSSRHSVNDESAARLDVDEVKSACLVALLDQSLRSPSGSTLWEIQKEVSSDGISERMISLALISLINDGLVDKSTLFDSDGDEYTAFRLSEQGSKFLLRSYSVLMQAEMQRVGARSRNKNGFSDEIPF